MKEHDGLKNASDDLPPLIQPKIPKLDFGPKSDKKSKDPGVLTP